MSSLHLIRTGIVACFAFIAPSVFAHPGHADSGLLSGFLHPFMGLDHIIVMLAIGLWAGRLGSKAVIAVPTAFVATMILACALAVVGLQVPFIEQGIILSVIFLGVLLAAASKFSTPICALFVAAFAFFHGAAHGIEMPSDVHASLYVLGFSISSVVLHAIGIVCNKAFSNISQLAATRLTGAIIAITGVGMAIG